jgi:N-acetylglucosamine kinase-like BadF-type ATPase|tara:strand:+ start:341 stop:1168 length:828 start_codon:yes stop_codon:yes gene_type:complete
MILIGDVGGTKTEWMVLENGVYRTFKTIGVNLVHEKLTEFLKKVAKSLQPFSEADQVFLYFAGLLDVPRQRRNAQNEIKKSFPRAKIAIENDLLGAARGAYQTSPGWIGILGTGANFAYYNGKVITQRIPSLGYILGDEGSGAAFGKKLLADFARQKLPADLEDEFRKAYKLDEATLISKVYGPTGSKAFLASFSLFLHAHLAHPYCHQLVYQAFLEHFKAVAGNYNPGTLVSYTGSIAYQFSTVLEAAAASIGIAIHSIVPTPIEGLANYHKLS